jgi:hypothetical protein
MNRHLSESEFVDLVEDTLDPRRAAHVETCPSCREQAATIRATLRDAGTVGVPEPSPLFWEHFSARVRDEIAAEPVAGPSGWMWRGIRGLGTVAAMAAVVIAVISAGLLIRAVGPGNITSLFVDRSVVVPPIPAPEQRPQGTPDAKDAGVWAVLTAAASSVELEDAHAAGMHVHPAAVDSAVQDLSTAELTELGRLLQSELKRSSN